MLVAIGLRALTRWPDALSPIATCISERNSYELRECWPDASRIVTLTGVNVGGEACISNSNTSGIFPT